MLTGFCACSWSLVASFVACACVICDNEASFASVIVHGSDDSDVVVSARVVVGFSAETVCNVLAFNTPSCVSALDSDPDAVDRSDDFPMLLCDVTRVVVGAVDANGCTAWCRVVTSRVLRVVLSYLAVDVAEIMPTSVTIHTWTHHPFFQHQTTSTTIEQLRSIAQVKSHPLGTIPHGVICVILILYRMFEASNKARFSSI